MTGAIRQQHGQQLDKFLLRVPGEQMEWIREYARSQEPPISISLAMTEAINALRAGKQQRDSKGRWVKK